MKTKNEPLVSVVIPTYKRADSLARAIESILNQTYKNVEIIVVDDNDAESVYRKNNIKFMKKYDNNQNVIYVCHEKNMNGSVARNTGISKAKGELVTFLDDDDYYYPSKIEKQVNYLIDNPEYGAVYCGWNRNGDITIPKLTGNLAYEVFTCDVHIYTPTIMMWRQYAVDCGGWDETFKRHQEAAFMLRYFEIGKTIGVVQEALIYIDLADRSNVLDPYNHEKQTFYYLNRYRHIIEKFDCKQRSEIYNAHTRAVLFCYIKKRKVWKAISLYLRGVKRYPIAFNLNLICYITSKKKKQEKYDE